MAKQLGNDERLFIQSATAGTYNQIAGQGNLTRGGSATQIDISAKTDAPYGSTAPGNITVNISVEGIVDLPDTNGLERAYTMWKTRAAEKYQIRKAPYAVGDVIFEGSMYITSFPADAAMNDGKKYTIELVNNGAPTTDLLG